MTAEALLNDLKRRGVELSARGDRLHVSVPVAVLTPDLKATLTQRKVELLTLLRSEAGDIACELGEHKVPAVEVLRGGGAPPEGPVAPTPTVPKGWHPVSWWRRLTVMAQEAEAVNPAKAAEFQAQADALEDRQ